MKQVSLASFSDSLAELRREIAGADAAAEHTSVIDASATAVRIAFASATPRNQLRYLLRALDDAISALEIAGHLGDAIHGVPAASESASDPLVDTYREFAESHEQLAALYRYRNAVSASLRRIPARTRSAKTATSDDTLRQ